MEIFLPIGLFDEKNRRRGVQATFTTLLTHPRPSCMVPALFGGRLVGIQDAVCAHTSRPLWNKGLEAFLYKVV
jgi:hypothetical protein